MIENEEIFHNLMMTSSLISHDMYHHQVLFAPLLCFEYSEPSALDNTSLIWINTTEVIFPLIKYLSLFRGFAVMFSREKKLFFLTLFLRH